MKRHVKRHLKLIAVVTVVTLALSGFSQARSGGGKGGGSRGGSSKSGGGGGGCGKDKSSRSSFNGGNYNNNSSSGNTSSGSGSPSRNREPDTRIVSCIATDTRTVVELVSRGRTETFTVHVDFRDEDGHVVDSVRERVRLKAGETRRVEVEPDTPGARSRVEECRLTDVV